MTRLIFTPHLAPDGSHVVYRLQRIDWKTEKNYDNLWIAPTGGGWPRQFTHGDQVDSQPCLSPDSEQIAVCHG